VNSRWN